MKRPSQCPASLPTWSLGPSAARQRRSCSAQEKGEGDRVLLPPSASRPPPCCALGEGRVGRQGEATLLRRACPPREGRWRGPKGDGYLPACCPALTPCWCFCSQQVLMWQHLLSFSVMLSACGVMLREELGSSKYCVIHKVGR